MHGAAFLPFGPWTEHRLAGVSSAGHLHPSDLEQYGPGGGGILEIGYRWCNRFGMDLQVDVVSVSTDEWDDYARSRGSIIDSWAMQWAFNLMFTVEVVRTNPFRFELRAGMGYLHVYGRERNESINLTYDYEPAGAAFSLRLGVGGLFPVGRGFDVVLLADLALGVPGVEYVGQSDRRVIALTTSLGFRWLSGAD